MVKKRLLIEKSLELFAKQGFEATSVQQITDLCGISKGAFYLSFKSKDELIMAIIDHFMMQIIADIDYTVRNIKNKEEILYEFYYTTLHSFGKHSSFAKIFIKEQALPLNEELLIKFREYDHRINRSILYMLQQLYGDDVKEIVYDLLTCIKGFMRTYGELNLHYNLNPNIDLVTKSLVEKTNILAKHVTIPFVSKEMVEMLAVLHTPPDIQEKEQIFTLIEQKIPELEDPIEIESLQVLRQNLLSESPSLAVTKGLLENLRSNPQCKWIAYLIREYYQL